MNQEILAEIKRISPHRWVRIRTRSGETLVGPVGGFGEGTVKILRWGQEDEAVTVRIDAIEAVWGGP